MLKSSVALALVAAVLAVLALDAVARPFENAIVVQATQNNDMIPGVTMFSFQVGVNNSVQTLSHFTTSNSRLFGMSTVPGRNSSIVLTADAFGNFRLTSVLVSASGLRRNSYENLDKIIKTPADLGVTERTQLGPYCMATASDDAMSCYITQSMPDNSLSVYKFTSDGFHNDLQLAYTKADVGPVGGSYIDDKGVLQTHILDSDGFVYFDKKQGKAMTAHCGWGYCSILKTAGTSLFPGTFVDQYGSSSYMLATRKAGAVKDGHNYNGHVQNQYHGTYYTDNSDDITDAQVYIGGPRKTAVVSDESGVRVYSRYDYHTLAYTAEQRGLKYYPGQTVYGGVLNA